MISWYFSTASNCEQKRDGGLWTHSHTGKCAMTDSRAVKKEGESHMPTGRIVCAFKDLKRATHVSLYQQNLQSKKRRAAIKLQLQAGDALHDNTFFFFFLTIAVFFLSYFLSAPDTQDVFCLH